MRKILQPSGVSPDFLNSGLKVCRKGEWIRREGAGISGLLMRAFFLTAAMMSAALSGCMRCSIPLNAPPYDPTQWGWGPKERFCVTRSYYGFAKDYPGTRPYRMVPPGAQAPLTPAGLTCPPTGPMMAPVWTAQAPTPGPTVAAGPTAIAF